MNTERLRKSLEEEKVRLESEMGSVGRKNPGVPGDWEAVPTETGQEPDEADQADVFVSGDTNAAILADLEARYDTVVSAIARMDKDEYGTCEVCGKKIEEERLEADPAAITCKEHK